MHCIGDEDGKDGLTRNIMIKKREVGWQECSNIPTSFPIRPCLRHCQATDKADNLGPLLVIRYSNGKIDWKFVLQHTLKRTYPPELKRRSWLPPVLFLGSSPLHKHGQKLRCLSFMASWASSSLLGKLPQRNCSLCSSHISQKLHTSNSCIVYVNLCLNSCRAGCV